MTAALFVSCSLLAFGSSPQEQAVMPVVTEGYEHAKLLDKKLLNRMADNVELNVVSSTMTPEGKVLETVEEDGLVFKYMRDPQTPRPTWKQLVKGRVLPKAETGGDEISTEAAPLEMALTSAQDGPNRKSWAPLFGPRHALTACAGGIVRRHASRKISSAKSPLCFWRVKLSEDFPCSRRRQSSKRSPMTFNPSATSRQSRDASTKS